MRGRRCSRAGCSRSATATLTYAYTDSTAVLGPLATSAEPHGYDLCAEHAQRLSVPRGWDVIRLARDEPEPGPSTDDLLALADAVREVGLTYDLPDDPVAHTPERSDGRTTGSRRAGTPVVGGNGIVELGRRGHLTVLADPG